MTTDFARPQIRPQASPPSLPSGKILGPKWLRVPEALPHIRMQSSTGDHPLDWCVRVWRWSVPIGVVLGVLFGVRDYTMSAGSPTPLPLAYWVSGEVAVVLFWSVLAPLVLFVMSRFPLRRKSWFQNALVHLLAYCGLAAVFTVYYWRIDTWLAPGPEAITHLSFLQTFSIAVSDGLTKYYGPILIAGYIAVYYARLREEEVRAANLSSELAQSQLRTLKMQVQPHFLFNTLHSISTLVYTDAKRADRMIAQLSDLLRTTLDERDFVSVREEIEYVQKYLGIEEMRFSDRLTVHYDIAPETLECTVPFLILQPIVENAVKHGISKKVHRGVISVEAFADGDWLRLKVVDNGPGLASTDQGLNARQGVGLKNTRERLEQVYGKEFQFLMRSDKGSGTIVEISIPGRIPNEAQEARQVVSVNDVRGGVYEEDQRAHRR